MWNQLRLSHCVIAFAIFASGAEAQNTFYKPRALKQPEVSPEFEEARRLALERYQTKQDEDARKQQAINEELARRAIADMRERDKTDQLIRQDIAERTQALSGAICHADVPTFEAIQYGASLIEVREIFGCIGRMTDGTRLPGVGTFQTYAFEAKSGDGVAMITFRGDRLMNKSQTGLR